MIDHVVVMAAPPSQNMGFLIRTRPKGMLPVLGRPLIARALEPYYRAGIRHFTLVVGEKEGSIVAWLSEKWYPDARLTFAPQGHRRGTASTLFAARKLVQDRFIITSCDILLPESHAGALAHYFDTYRSDTAVLSLGKAQKLPHQGAGVLRDPRGRVLFVSEDPIAAHQDYMTALPVYGFTPHVLAYLDRVPVKEQSGEHAITSAIQMMIDDGQSIGAVETPAYTGLDAPDDLFKTNLDWLAAAGQGALLSEIPASARIIQPVHVDPGVMIEPEAQIGPLVYLETGTVVERGARLARSVILGRRIGKGRTVENMLVKEDLL